jgi:hypothetical protein
MSKNLIKVRVTFKNPIDRKTSVMQMTEEMIKFYRSSNGKRVSPYSKISVIKI